MQITLERGGACDYTSTALGLRVYVGNVGGSAAGPFVVEANGLRQTVVEGLAAGATTSLWFERYVYLGNNTVTVDATDLVEESDEANNQRSELVAIPTLPPTCTATPTPSMTPTATATPTSTGTARATEECRSDAAIPTRCYRVYVPLVQARRSP